MGNLKEEYSEDLGLDDYGTENTVTGQSSVDGGQLMNLSKKEKVRVQAGTPVDVGNVVKTEEV